MFDPYVIPTEKAAIVILSAPKGFVMCGYLNIEAADRLGDAAAMVTGVATADDALKARISALTKAAKDLGVREGMSCEQALSLMQ